MIRLDAVLPIDRSDGLKADMSSNVSSTITGIYFSFLSISSTENWEE